MLLGILESRAGDFAGSAVCARCHAEEARRHAATPHARALQKQPTQWAFGSGLQAITYVSQIDAEHYLEHGLTEYSRTGKKDLTPGHQDAKGVRYRTFAPSAALLRCFQCHGTGDVTVDAKGAIGIAEAGVQCEACHGPGAGHAANPQLPNQITHPGKLSPTAQNELCGACHRKASMVEGHLDWSNPWNTRHQPLYFSQSRCFLASQKAPANSAPTEQTNGDGGLRCSTCHQAHAAKPAGSGTCNTCHATPRHSAAVAGAVAAQGNGRPDCITCHMPTVPAGPHLRFANHWIGIYRPGQPLQPVKR